MKKKIVALGLSLMMCVGALAGCGSSSSSSASSEGTADSAVEEQAETGAEAQTEAEGGSSIESIHFGTNAEFPPFEFVTANGVIGEYDGIDMAIAVKIGEILGCEIQMDNMEFDSLIASIATGKIDASIAGMTVTDERKESVDFSTPYYTATQVMIVPEDSDIASAADMTDKKITVVQGFTGQTVVESLDLPFEAFKKGTECIAELKNGKCDVVVIDSATADKYVADNPGLKIVEDPEVFESEEYAIAVAKGNTELLDAINSAIDQMLADGTIGEISEQYLVAEE